MSQSFGARHRKVAICAAIGAGAAALSFDHALTVARWYGTEGSLAYVVPALSDGLVVLSSVTLYEASQAGRQRPRAAVFGLVLGVVVTLVLNVVSGWHHGWGGRLLNGLAPVVLLVAVAVLEGDRLRGRDGLKTSSPHAVADLGDRCPHGPASGPDEAIRLDFEHRRDCLLEPVSHRDHAAWWGVSKTKVTNLVSAPPAGVAALNGQGPHE